MYFSINLCHQNSLKVTDNCSNESNLTTAANLHEDAFNTFLCCYMFSFSHIVLWQTYISNYDQLKRFYNWNFSNIDVNITTVYRKKAAQVLDFDMDLSKKVGYSLQPLLCLSAASGSSQESACFRRVCTHKGPFSLVCSRLSFSSPHCFVSECAEAVLLLWPLYKNYFLTDFLILLCGRGPRRSLSLFDGAQDHTLQTLSLLV